MLPWQVGIISLPTHCNLWESLIWHHWPMTITSFVKTFSRHLCLPHQLQRDALPQSAPPWACFTLNTAMWVVLPQQFSFNAWSECYDGLNNTDAHPLLIWMIIPKQFATHKLIPLKDTPAAFKLVWTLAGHGRAKIQRASSFQEIHNSNPIRKKCKTTQCFTSRGPVCGNTILNPWVIWIQTWTTVPRLLWQWLFIMFYLDCILRHLGWLMDDGDVGCHLVFNKGICPCCNGCNCNFRMLLKLCNSACASIPVCDNELCAPQCQKTINLLCHCWKQNHCWEFSFGMVTSTHHGIPLKPRTFCLASKLSHKCALQMALHAWLPTVQRFGPKLSILGTLHQQKVHLLIEQQP